MARRHFTGVLAGDWIGSLFGTFVEHAGSFDQFLSMGHGGTSVRVHMPLCMVKTLFPQVGHGYLILAIDHRARHCRRQLRLAKYVDRGEGAWPRNLADDRSPGLSQAWSWRPFSRSWAPSTCCTGLCSTIRQIR